MEKLNEDSTKTHDLGTEELIQCLEIKTETNDSSEINAGGRALGKEKQVVLIIYDMNYIQTKNFAKKLFVTLFREIKVGVLTTFKPE